MHLSGIEVIKSNNQGETLGLLGWKVVTKRLQLKFIHKIVGCEMLANDNTYLKIYGLTIKYSQFFSAQWRTERQRKFLSQDLPDEIKSRNT